MSGIPLTVAGAKRLNDELANLKTVERPAVIEAIAVARAHGDLSENAEYDAARERQSFVEGRIKELESVLSAANIIDPATLDAGDRIVFGATVELEDLDTGEQLKYQIVGDIESDIRQNLISVSSPVARALIGKHEGDVVTVMVPSGEREFEILLVEYL
ncbi:MULTISPECIES: transcription elongation factor GreA [Oligella]|uniref:Transcription elongation factor GreA n=2 Tax=Oligella urethralis TaxID=90245 RepID=A0A096AKM1_9BURK|nr:MULTISPECIES: transcription elongation factor GreA [Oligella]AVL70538.1 transcription elongation factor GreA [Oligella urethralis]KGF31212.1 transcription elongation factor GreA [Oligella urethralis DNF00040]MDK6202814.1 transcription elongation factor GreA [Oligella urethralis]OFS89360.1 transcription elongation factor GreA [Oligella sp. HMSC05A10]OFV46745.1 transcription elongation factor GreA [Oligella sp. HMSC09E12]